MKVPTVKIIYKEEVFAVIGAAIEVHNMLGCGFLEAVYQEAFEAELAARNIPHTSKQEIPIFYKGRRLKKCYEADLIAYNKIVIEIKALDQLTTREEAQILNYLKATGMEVGLLINFGTEKLEWKRKVLTRR